MTQNLLQKMEKKQWNKCCVNNQRRFKYISSVKNKIPIIAVLQIALQFIYYNTG